MPKPVIRLVVEKKYNPDQPRVPRGSPIGGQWVDDASAAGGGQPGSAAGKVSVQYDEYASGDAKKMMDHFGVTEDQVRRMFSLSGYRADITIVTDEDPFNPENPNPPGFSVHVTWKTADEEPVGFAHRAFYAEESGLNCINDELKLDPEFQGLGLAKELYERQIEILAKESKVDKIMLNANVSIGKYAWAKRGFQYKVKSRGNLASQEFEFWAAGKGIDMPPSGRPVFNTPQDVANYRLPGITVPHTAIDNPDIKPGDYEVGKAFMLDKAGHGSWSAVLWLKNKS